MEHHSEKIGREYLKELEKTGKYVFHGSPDGGVDVMEPRQAYNHYEGNRYTPPGVCIVKN